MKSEVFLQQKIKLGFPVFLILFFMTGLQKYNPVSTQFLFGICFMENFFYKVREKTPSDKVFLKFLLTRDDQNGKSFLEFEDICTST